MYVVWSIINIIYVVICTALIFGVFCAAVICGVLLNTEKILLLLRQDPEVAK